MGWRPQAPAEPWPSLPPIFQDSSPRKEFPVLPSWSQLLLGFVLPEAPAPKAIRRWWQSSESQPGREAQTPTPLPTPVSATGCQDPGLVPCPHLPVEFIVVIVDFPPEVEPGECEAEGDGEEQEPEAFPLEGQSRKGVKWGQGLAQQTTHLNVPPL